MTKSNDEIIKKLQNTGITNQEILDAATQILKSDPKTTDSEIFSETKTVQITQLNEASKPLIIGTHPITLYLITGIIVTHFYISSMDKNYNKKILKTLNKLGYKNVELIEHDKLNKVKPFEDIILDFSYIVEPKDLIDLLAENGTLLIKRAGDKRELIKITKTSTGYYRENFDSEILTLP